MHNLRSLARPCCHLAIHCLAAHTKTPRRLCSIAVTQIEAGEIDTLTRLLARHLVTYFSAPSEEAALPVAAEEIAQMAELCDEHAPNTLLTVARELTEAGVREAKIQPVPIGTYGYSKVLDNGASAPIETQVYLARVCEMSDTYPEAPERQRRWVSAEDAANMVDEPGLQDILRAI